LKDITLEILKELFASRTPSLLATQKRLCLPVINRIYKKMRAGIFFSGIKVHDDCICDGHHRYIASVLAGYQIDQQPGVLASAHEKISWKDVVFDHDDWDTIAKIRMLNEQDAVFNNLTVEEIITMIK
jgi:hypothetical protein